VTRGVLRATHALQAVMDIFLLEPDLGEGDISRNPSWRADAEPVPAPLDAWSRGAIKLKEKKALGPRMLSPPASEAGSVHGGSRPSSSSSRRGSTSKAGGPPAAPMGTVPEVNKQGIPVAKSRDPPSQDKAAGKVEKLMTLSEEAHARKAVDEREDFRRLEELRSSMRGRDYTTDAAGNIIPVDSVVPERLPPYKLYPGIGLRTGEDAALPPHKKGSKAAKDGSKGAGARGVRVELGASKYKPLTSLQPPLMETMQVREGITLREADAVKEGGSRPADPERMSRKDFELFARTAQARADSLASEPLDGAALGPARDVPVRGRWHRGRRWRRRRALVASDGQGLGTEPAAASGGASEATTCQTGGDAGARRRRHRGGHARNLRSCLPRARRHSRQRPRAAALACVALSLPRVAEGQGHLRSRERRLGNSAMGVWERDRRSAGSMACKGTRHESRVEARRRSTSAERRAQSAERRACAVRVER
jgi:hypothetical protein